MNKYESLPIPISVVERETQLTKDTLRKWETRYGFPTPQRDANGERIYSAHEVECLRLIKVLLNRGLRPVAVVGKPMDVLQALQKETNPTAPTSYSPEVLHIMELLRTNQVEALRPALKNLMLRLGMRDFVGTAFGELNHAVGSYWEQGQLSIFQEHCYTDVMQRFMLESIAAVDQAYKNKTVLLTTPPTEEHSLGLLMVQALCVLQGVRCISLGTKVPLTDMAQAAKAYGAQVVALTFSITFPTRQIAPLLRELHELLPEGVEIWAGGAGVGSQRIRIAGVKVFNDLDGVSAALRELAP